MLGEIPGELEMLPWQSMRDAMLWGTAKKAERGALFAEGAARARLDALLAAGVPAEVAEPLRTMGSRG